MKINIILKLIIAIFVSELAGIIGAFFTTPSIPNWYAGLTKPSFNPPSWIFGPVWTTLFALMGVAAFLVWSRYGKTADESLKGIIKIALIIFVIQLVLNTFWSIIFFGWHSPGGAFVEIIFLWLAILATIIYFAKVSKLAMWLLIPYILWVSFAGFLNYTIWHLNKGSAVAVIQNNDKIQVTYPKANDKIVSPLVIKGEARGSWYFEASFPVTLTNWDGLIIAQGIAQAEGDWMTTNFVPFTATLNFEKPSYGERGFLILKKDNPSGLPQNDDSIEIPIYFK